jgi:predicted nucleic acid-binding Zn ribbon protein
MLTSGYSSKYSIQSQSNMATYVYETVPQKAGDPVRRFEVQQSMRDEPLKADPETGLPVKRVILGGYGIMTKSAGPAGGCGAGECEMPAAQAGHTCSSPSCCCN